VATRQLDLLLLRPTLADVPERPLPEGYRLRLATHDDDMALAETLTAAFEEKWDAARVSRDLTGARDVVATYVADWQGRPVATASSRWLPDRFPRAGYVHWVGTDPAHARRGLAAALLVELLRHFAEVGREQAVLETQDFRHPAIRSYLRLGFTPVYEVGTADHRARWSAIFQQLG
jgi:GNAT superfamily N-acetyltransferase